MPFKKTAGSATFVCTVCVCVCMSGCVCTLIANAVCLGSLGHCSELAGHSKGSKLKHTHTHTHKNKCANTTMRTGRCIAGRVKTIYCRNSGKPNLVQNKKSYSDTLVYCGSLSLFQVMVCNYNNAAKSFKTQRSYYLLCYVKKVFPFETNVSMHDIH